MSKSNRSNRPFLRNNENLKLANYTEQVTTKEFEIVKRDASNETVASPNIDVDEIDKNKQIPFIDYIKKFDLLLEAIGLEIDGISISGSVGPHNRIICKDASLKLKTQDLFVSQKSYRFLFKKVLAVEKVLRRILRAETT